uniref:uncharacterized protein LOC124064246 n=1 Tax=Scatophagus argus TaxID=75038 RepID=UPI001ED85FB3|nr:uncharacterized protein LOC124064246 [Scatophagus argus]
MTSKGEDTKVKNLPKVALKSNGESGTSTAQESAAPAKAGLRRGSKRKASPERSAPLKKIRGYDPEPTKDIFKRNVKEGGEGPSETRRSTPDINQGEKESASSSADTDNESSSKQSNLSNVEEVSKRTGKRKAAAADEEQPQAKRRKDLPTKKNLINAQRAEFEAKYKQQNQLGKGGYGCVFAGYRKADNLPVAIKHITKQKGQNGKQLPSEVAVMLKLQAGKTGLSGESAAVSLLDWYDLDQELILVLERPVPCMDLLRYVRGNGGALHEEKAKVSCSSECVCVRVCLCVCFKHFLLQEIKDLTYCYIQPLPQVLLLFRFSPP